MTVEKYINENSYFILNADTPMGNILREAMVGYAQLKCKELLEIVAEKAEIKKRYRLESNGFPTVINLVDEEPNIDKDSILNAVDLKEFIK
jgi:hypothetical protein